MCHVIQNYQAIQNNNYNDNNDNDNLKKHHKDSSVKNSKNHQVHMCSLQTDS